MIHQVNNKIKLRCWFCVVSLLFLIRHSGFGANPVCYNDTIYLKIKNIQISPCKKGKNTVRMNATNIADGKIVFAIHIQSNIRISASVGRGWGTVFYDTIPSGKEKEIEHSFPFYSDPDDGITLRIQFYQLTLSEKWDFQNYFFTKTYDHHEIPGLCSETKYSPEVPEVNIIDEFRRIQALLRNGFIPDIWNSLTKSYREAQYQDDYDSFGGKITNPHPIDCWNAEQFLKLNPQEYLELTDGRILLSLTLDDTSWSIYFKYLDDQWKIDWIDGFTTLVDLWTTWPARLLPKMQKVSSEHFDFYYFKDSYAENTIADIVKIREDGYKRIYEYLGLEMHPRITTVFFNDLATKAYETGHRGKGAAFDTTVIEVYNEEMQAHPFHETVHILTNSIGFPPAIFFEGLAEYLEIALMDKDSIKLFEALENQISKLKQSDDWIPIQELMKFTDIPGPSQADVSYPEAAAFVKFLIDKYGKQKFFNTYRSLVNSDEESIIVENTRKLEKIYGLPIDVLVGEFHRYYQ